MCVVCTNWHRCRGIQWTCFTCSTFATWERPRQGCASTAKVTHSGRIDTYTLHMLYYYTHQLRYGPLTSGCYLPLACGWFYGVSARVWNGGTSKHTARERRTQQRERPREGDLDIHTPLSVTFSRLCALWTMRERSLSLATFSR